MGIRSIFLPLIRTNSQLFHTAEPYITITITITIYSDKATELTTMIETPPQCGHLAEPSVAQFSVSWYGHVEFILTLMEANMPPQCTHGLVIGCIHSAICMRILRLVKLL